MPATDAAGADAACSRYDKFAAEFPTQRIAKNADPRFDRGELHEGDRAVCDIWRPLRRFPF